jgi:hypothetical protein
VLLFKTEGEAGRSYRTVTHGVIGRRRSFGSMDGDGEVREAPQDVVDCARTGSRDMSTTFDGLSLELAIGRSQRAIEDWAISKEIWFECSFSVREAA